MNIIGKLICFVMGHKRGRKIDTLGRADGVVTSHVYKCNRCGDTWTRKVKPKKAVR